MIGNGSSEEMQRHVMKINNIITVIGDKDKRSEVVWTLYILCDVWDEKEKSNPEILQDSLFVNNNNNYAVCE